MMDSFQAPTDNLYKFLAIGGLAFVFLAAYYLLREQSRLRDIYIDSQVALIATGYQEGTGVPKDKEMAQAYARREFAKEQTKELLGNTTKLAARIAGVAFLVSIAGFVAWWLRVQRYEDAILQAAARLKKSEATH